MWLEIEGKSFQGAQGYFHDESFDHSFDYYETTWSYVCWLYQICATWIDTVIKWQWYLIKFIYRNLKVTNKIILVLSDVYEYQVLFNSKTLTLQCNNWIKYFFLLTIYFGREATLEGRVLPVILLKQGLSCYLCHSSLVRDLLADSSVSASHATTAVMWLQMNTTTSGFGYHTRFTQQVPLPTEPTSQPLIKCSGR